jgi:hypothetical protein
MKWNTNIPLCQNSKLTLKQLQYCTLNNKKNVRITLNEAQITEAELKRERIALKGENFCN